MGGQDGIWGRRRRLLAIGALIALAVPLVSSRASATDQPANWSPTPVRSWQLDGVGYATAVIGSTVYVGGAFSSVRSPDGYSVATRHNLAAFDLSTGVLKPAFRADTNGAVRALVASGGRLVVGGSYTTIGGVSRGRLAAVDPTTGAVASLAADANSNVYALAAADGRVYVGGSFSTIKGAGRTRIAALDASTWAPTAYAPTVDATVHSIAAATTGGRVYFGGPFTRVDGVANTWLATTDSAGTRIPMVWQGLQGLALDLSINASGTRLAVAQGGAGNQGSWYDTATGARLWGQRCDGDAQAVHIVDGTMTTGFHEACAGDATQRLTANATADGARDASFRPTFDRFWGVYDIAGDAEHLVIAGDVTTISGQPVQGFAIFPRRQATPVTTTTTTTTTAPPTTTTTRPPTTTTTTTAPPTTTTTVAPAPSGTTLLQSSFTGANGAAWPGWTASSASGGVTIQGNAGRLASSDVANAFARAQLTALPARSDLRVRFSYQWSSNAAGAYLNLYVRGSGGWSNGYRPRTGYGLELASNAGTVTVRKVSGGTVSSLRSVAAAQSATTRKQWIVLRVSGSTLQFKTWLDGAAEPAAWTTTLTDASITAPGQVHLSLVRGASSVGARSVTIDDLTVTAS